MKRHEVKQLLESKIPPVFQQPIQAPRDTVFGEIDQNEVTFKDVFNLEECVFEAEVSFEGSTFKKAISFYECTFGVGKTAENSQVAKCTFSNVKFYDTTYFGGATFHSKVRFHQV